LEWLDDGDDEDDEHEEESDDDEFPDEMETRKKRVVIVGGVAGGASCAARVRRLDESAEVTIFDRGPFVSFANCGLPYFVGDVIHDEKKLLVASSVVRLVR
jgi:flavin-dependent dehydrogenase